MQSSVQDGEHQVDVERDTLLEYAQQEEAKTSNLVQSFLLQEIGNAR